MVQIAGKPFTQLTNLNLTDELRIKGEIVNSGAENLQFNIKSSDDFRANSKAFSATTITLLDDSDYFIHGFIEMGGVRLITQNGTNLIGQTFGSDGISSSNTATLEIPGSGQFMAKSISLRNEKAAGLIIDAGDSTDKNVNMVFENVEFFIDSTDTSQIGQFENVTSATLINCLFNCQRSTPSTVLPLKIFGTVTFPVFKLHLCRFINLGGLPRFIFLPDTDAVKFDACEISNNVMDDSTILIEGESAGVFMQTGKMGLITDNRFANNTDSIKNITVTDLSSQWMVKGNITIPDNKVLAVVNAPGTVAVTLTSSFSALEEVFVNTLDFNDFTVNLTDGTLTYTPTQNRTDTFGIYYGLTANAATGTPGFGIRWEVDPDGGGFDAVAGELMQTTLATTTENRFLSAYAVFDLSKGDILRPTANTGTSVSVNFINFRLSVVKLT